MVDNWLKMSFMILKYFKFKFHFDFIRLVAAVVATSATSLMFYRYITKHFNKFEKLGIPYEKGHFPSGSFNLLRPDLTHMYEHLANLHKKHASERYCGWFLFGQPVLNINDPELLRQIMVKDFNSFVERTGYDSTVFQDGGRYNNHDPYKT